MSDAQWKVTWLAILLFALEVYRSLKVTNSGLGGWVKNVWTNFSTGLNQ